MMIRCAAPPHAHPGRIKERLDSAFTDVKVTYVPAFEELVIDGKSAGKEISEADRATVERLLWSDRNDPRILRLQELAGKANRSPAEDKEALDLLLRQVK